MSYVIASALEVISWNRNKKWVFILFFLFIWILFWGTHTCPDYINYAYLYKSMVGGTPINNFSIDNVEKGFGIIYLLASKAGMPLDVFFAIYAFIGLLLLTKTILRYAENPSIVLGLYFLYPFFLDIAQKRSFMGAAIIISAVPYLMETEKFGMIKYTLCCILATTIHTSCILFLIFLVLRFQKKHVKMLTIFIGVFLVISPKLTILFSTVLPGFAYRKLAGYLANLSFIFNDAIDILFFLAIDISVVWVCNKYLKRNKNSEKRGFYFLMLKMSVLLIGVLPLVYVNPIFSRLPRALLPLQYTVLVNVVWKKNKKALKTVIWSVIILALVGSRFVIWHFTEIAEILVYPIMNENIFLQG